MLKKDLPDNATPLAPPHAGAPPRVTEEPAKLPRGASQPTPKAPPVATWASKEEVDRLVQESARRSGIGVHSLDLYRPKKGSSK